MDQLQGVTTGVVGRTEFRQILVGCDESEHALKALRGACILARMSPSKLVVVNVCSPPAYYVVGPDGLIGANEEDKNSLQKKAEALIAEAVGIARSEAVEASGEVLNSPSAVEAITRYASMNEVDLIVLGIGRSGLRRLIEGSVPSGVIAHAHCPVLIMR